MRWLPTDRRAWGSLRVRLTAWNTAVALLMVLACVVTVRFTARAALYREADSVLRGECTEVALASAAFLPDTKGVVNLLQRKAASHEERGWFSHLLTEDGATIWRSDACPDVVAAFPPARKDRLENVVQLPGYRYVRRRIEVPDQPTLHVRIGMSTRTLDADARAVTRLLLPLGGILALLTPLAGYWLAVGATRPVADILRTAERLRPTRLGDRLTLSGTGDELDQLATTINRLLDQVAGHVDRQRRFLADAAHELRGPLAAIRTSLEVAASRDRTATEYRETLGDVLDETRQLAKLTNDLLLLAEADEEPGGVGTAAGTAVDLALLAGQAIAMFAGVAEERGIDVALAADARGVVRGDAVHLRQVLGNLLDNAIRFTPAGGRVRVSVATTADADEVLLQVADTGIGIAAADVSRVFDRFFKADTARARGTARSGGLGLPISRAIVERHGGTMTLASEPDRGTVVTIRLPAALGATPATTPPAGEAGHRPAAVAAAHQA